MASALNASATNHLRPVGPAPARRDDELLVAALKAGDHAIWEARYRTVYPGLLAYARRRLGADDARDAVNETMTRAVDKVSSFECRGVSFDGWLYGILRHVVADATRSRIRRLTPGALAEDQPVPEPSERLIHREEARAVRRAFACLTPADQELLELRVVRGLSSDDVASIVGKRPGAVRMGQSRALQRLRNALERPDER